MTTEILSKLFDKEVSEVAKESPDKLYFMFEGDTVYSYIGKWSLMIRLKDMMYDYGFSLQTVKYFSTSKGAGLWDIKVFPRAQIDHFCEQEPLYHKWAFKDEYSAVRSIVEHITSKEGWTWEKK